MAELHGKIAFVTGAGSGLGRASALAFAAAGARVAVNDLRADAAAAVGEELGAHRACEPLVGDVADSATVRRWFVTLAQATGNRLDILVNNAGYADTDPETLDRIGQQMREMMATGRTTTSLAATERMSDERWARMLAVHLNGTFYCTREALKSASPSPWRARSRIRASS
jgi:3-oxoacyl-[acyl-carrier protein] reductase